MINHRYNSAVLVALELSIVFFILFVFIGFLPELKPTIYLYSLVIILPPFLLYIGNKLKPGCVFYIASFYILFFILGYRDLSGIDDMSYFMKYNDVKQMKFTDLSLGSGLEPLFFLLNSGFSKLNIDYIYFQMVCSFIPLFLFYFILYKERKIISSPLALLLFISILYFQILAVALVRMFIAISIVFYSIIVLSTGNKRKFITSVILASLFHYSALFMLVFTPLWKKSLVVNKWKSFIGYIIIVFPVFLIFLYLFLNKYGTERYVGYMVFNSFEFNASSLTTLPLFFYSWFRMRVIPEENIQLYIIALVCLSISSVVTFYSTIIPLGRLIFYLNTSLIILLPMIYRNEKNVLYKLLCFVLILMFVFFYLYVSKFTLEAHIPHLVPYKNIYFIY